MTPAEFKTLREALNLSAQALADLLGLRSDRTIRYWESGRSRIPEGAAAELARLDATVERGVAEAVALFQDRTHTADPQPPDVALLRYHSDADLELYQPETFASLGSGRVHAALIARTRQALERLGAAVSIAFMEPEAYEAWRAEAGLDDDPAARATWAALGRGGGHD